MGGGGYGGPPGGYGGRPAAPQQMGGPGGYGPPRPDDGGYGRGPPAPAAFPVTGPNGWVAYKTQDTSEVYYHNHNSQVTQWDPPADWPTAPRA
jgi:hypothetical protein